MRQSMLWLTARPEVRSVVQGTRWGRALVRRFVAGDGIEDAVRAARGLQHRGIGAMVNRLGEAATTEDEAEAATATWLEDLRTLRAHPDLDVAVSLKLTALGLDQSPSLCRENLERILRAAGNRFLVMIDMESYRYVDRTLALFREVRQHATLGVCLQAYLTRTARDVFELPPRSTVRLVKGAYAEPSEVAFRSKASVDRAWSLLFATLVARGHVVHAATHDPALIAGARELMRRHDVPRGRVEFQFLYGVRADLQERLAREGEPVRVYVPYGTEWYPYLTRRLAERPANLWFFVRHLAQRSGT